MMEWNLLSQILVFLKRQQGKGYQGVNFCIAIMEDKNRTPEEKSKALIKLLKKMELIDDDEARKISKELRHETLIQIMKSDSVWNAPGMGSTYVTQLFDCDFLNGKIWFECGLN